MNNADKPLDVKKILTHVTYSPAENWRKIVNIKLDLNNFIEMSRVKFSALKKHSQRLEERIEHLELKYQDLEAKFNYYNHGSP